MENDKTKVYVVITLMAGLVLGYYYGSARSYSLGYDKARLEIKSRLEEKRIIEPVAKEVRIISGVIKSIGDNRFILESHLPFDPTLSEDQQNRLATKTILVTASTKISIRTLETDQEPRKPGGLVQPFVVKNLKTDFKSLRISEVVVVEAEENIANKSSFEASAIFKNSNN